jgi:hypothetical protein
MQTGTQASRRQLLDVNGIEVKESLPGPQGQAIAGQ